MSDSEMDKYMRLEMWMDRVEHTITSWENIQGIKVPDEIRETVTKFMRTKIQKGINRKELMKMFFQIAVTSLIYIKMKRLDK